MKFAQFVPSIAIVAMSLMPSSVRAQSAPAEPPRPTVAVLDFDFTAAQERAVPGQRAARGKAAVPNIAAINVGKGIADLLVAELVNSGDLRVLERQRLADIAREQQGGDTVKARYLVMG